MISEDKKVKLELVQISGIVNLLMEKCDHNLLELRVNSLKNTDIRNLKKALQRLSRKDLICLVEKSSEITDADIDKIYELNRYGLRPGFSLCRFNMKSKDIQPEKLKKYIAENLDVLQFAEDEQYKKLKVKSVEDIAADTLEITFSYLSKHTYLSEEEKPEYVYEYKDTFAWVNINEGYLAVKNAPDRIMSLIKQVFASIYGGKIITVCITKKMISEIFQNSTLKKGTYYKPNASEDEPQKVTISDANLSEKPNVRQTYKAYDMTATSLEENVNDDISSTLGINCKQGKIYLSKNLNASDFRAWSIKRIKDIIKYMGDKDLELTELFKANNPLDDICLKKYTVPQKEMIEDILHALFCIKSQDLDAYALNSMSSDLLNKMDKMFYKEFVCNCDECEDLSIVNCPLCGSTHFSITKDRKLTCLGCGEQQEGSYELSCDAGHTKTFWGIEKIVSLTPTAELLEDIKTVLNETLNIKMKNNETFYIFNGKLTLLQCGTKGEVLSISDIKELTPVEEIPLDVPERDTLLEEYKKIKEKCRTHTNEACNRCKYEKKKCIMSLFIPFDFRPSPHQNSEFGDVNFQVTYSGENKRLVGIAKSKAGELETLSVSTKEAREMLQQVLTMTHDRRAEIIAPICPMRFHPQLSAELEYIAKLTGKKLVILDDEFMVRLLKYNNILNKINK